MSSMISLMSGLFACSMVPAFLNVFLRFNDFFRFQWVGDFYVVCDAHGYYNTGDFYECQVSMILRGELCL